MTISITSRGILLLALGLAPAEAFTSVWGSLRTTQQKEHQCCLPPPSRFTRGQLTLRDGVQAPEYHVIEPDEAVAVEPTPVAPSPSTTSHVVNETQVPLDSKKQVKEYDPITDWHPPSPELVEQAIEERVRPLRRLVSPVFFSTDKNGKRHVGLSRIPNNRPLLIVGNHQLGGFDMWLVGAELIEERGIFVRGLGHPVIFQDDKSALGGGPSFLPKSLGDNTFGLYKSFGAVMATPRNFYRLMQTKQAVLHFPGGAREAYHRRGEEYQIFWPNQTDFVRTAAKFNATIVPLSAIGAADSVNILLDPEDMLRLPFGMGGMVANSFLTVREAARYDEHGHEYIRPPPLVWPKLMPARHYFLFGTPFDLSKLDSRDREACQEVYEDIQAEMRRGFANLLRAREHDPFSDSKGRFVYEQVTGKKAPTFPIEELNKPS